VHLPTSLPAFSYTILSSNDIPPIYLCHSVSTSLPENLKHCILREIYNICNPCGTLIPTSIVSASLLSIRITCNLWKVVYCRVIHINIIRLFAIYNKNKTTSLINHIIHIKFVFYDKYFHPAYWIGFKLDFFNSGWSVPLCHLWKYSLLLYK